MDKDSRIRRLVDVARLYYEQDENQNEIAARYGISRPMVSRLLKEAKAMGIVTVRVRMPGEADGTGEGLMERLRLSFGIRGGAAVKDGDTDQSTNRAVAEAALWYLESLRRNRLGIGWGHIIGDLVSWVERQNRQVSIGAHICPLIGNGGVGLKNYHSNELVRVLAEHSGAEPEFLYSPACALTEQELKLTRELENYHEVRRAWEDLDVALVNIGNFPSTPDFASGARFGDLLVKQKAVGRILNYYIDISGQVIHSDMDYAIQIPLELLEKVGCVVGICSANTRPEALCGALCSGFISHLIAPEHVIKAALEIEK